MISISNLQKSYGKLHVLKGIDLEIGDGAITAILGPNGAGKTTLIKSILGLVKPDGGSVTVNGTRLNGNSDYRRDLGYMPQTARYPENLTVREIIDMVKDIRGYEHPTDEMLVGSFRLDSELGKKFKTLSGGNRQKVSAVVAFLFNPKIIFLDEPTAGLDPVSSSKLKDKIQAEKAAGKSIILTSHILSEVQELADRVIYILEGRIAFDSPMQNLLDQTGEATLERAVAQMIEQDEKTSRQHSGMNVTGNRLQPNGQMESGENAESGQSELSGIRRNKETKPAETITEVQS
jgi:Cu-processing system ATP-binding protein